MMRYFVIWICVGFAVTAQGTTVDAMLERARNARAEGLGVAAVHGLRRALEGAEGPQRIEVAVELARCLVDANRENEAISLLDADEFKDSADVKFWLAQAQAEAGHYAQALELYGQAAADTDFEMRDDAAFGLARMHDALGKSQQALRAYAAIPEESRWHDGAQLGAAAILAERGRTDRAWKFLETISGPNRRDREMQRYLAGRVLLESGDYEGVRAQYDGFAPRNRRLAAGATIGEADALIQEGRAADAERILETFVWENPRNPMLPAVFAKLDEARARQNAPSNATLKRWENESGNATLAALATWLLARSDEREGRIDRAIRTYREFLTTRAHDPSRFDAAIRLARLLLARGERDEASQVLEEAEGLAGNRRDRAAVKFLAASAMFDAGGYAGATRMFVDVASMDPEISEAALSNAALAAIRSGNEPLAAEVMNALFKEHPATAQRVEFAQAMQSAAQGNPDAGELLAWIAGHGGAEARSARLASAEWKWMQGDPHGARAEYLRVANRTGNGGVTSGQEDYFAVYLADDGSVDAGEKVATAARRYLEENPRSEHEAEVRMKWGEVLARSGDQTGARAQFELAAAAARSPALAREANFLAGRAATRSMNPEQFEEAIALFEQVAGGGDPVLASQARLEQASLRNALGQPGEAVKLLDSLIAATSDDRVRAAAGLMKAASLLSMGDEGRAAAILALREVADAGTSTPAERNEALVRLAGAREAAGDFDGALAAYYEVLNAPRDGQPEFYWYYRAGFDAARLLHEREMLKEEAAVLEKMAMVEGPRAEEAAERVKRLRLENFIWED